MGLAFVVSAGCMEGAASGGSSEGVEEEILRQLRGVDFLELAATPWVIMHSLLLLPEGSCLRLGQQTTSIESILWENGIGAFAPLMALNSSGEFEARQGRFAYELEDHFGQFWCLRAMGMADREREELEASSQGEWRRTADAFLKLADEVRDQAAADRPELSWLIALGVICAEHVKDDDSKQAIVARLESFVELEIPHRPPACGGLHGLVALALCERAAMLPPATRESSAAIVSGLRAAINEAVQEDGYVPWPGLDDPFFPRSTADEVRVLAHVVELLSFCGSPLSVEERRVVERFRMALAQLPALEKLQPWTLGHICHGVGALRRLRMRGMVEP